MTGPLPLDEHDVHLVTLALPIDVRLAADIGMALHEVAERHGLQRPTLLFDGTNRIVARKIGAPDRVPPVHGGPTREQHDMTDTKPYPPFSGPAVLCPKCGGPVGVSYRDVGTVFVRSGPDATVVGHGAGPEWLLRHCLDCDYGWPEQCRPAGVENPSGVTWVVGERREGRTTALVRWLCEGQVLDGWPGWSRLLVVGSDQRVPQIGKDHPDLDRVLRDRGCPGGLGKVVLGPSDFRANGPGMRGMVGVELAIDDVETFLPALFMWPGAPVRVLAVTGRACRPGALGADVATGAPAGS